MLCFQDEKLLLEIELENGVCVDETSNNAEAILWSSVANRKSVTKLLIKYGANVNMRSRFMNHTPLHCAAGANALETTILLLENGANPENKNENGNTPLHEACESDSVDIIKLLLEYGANRFTRNKKGFFPLNLCVSCEAKKLLQEYFPFPFVKNCKNQKRIKNKES